MSWDEDEWGDMPPRDESQDQAVGISEEWDDFEPFEVYRHVDIYLWHVRR